MTRNREYRGILGWVVCRRLEGSGKLVGAAGLRGSPTIEVELGLVGLIVVEVVAPKPGLKQKVESGMSTGYE